MEIVLGTSWANQEQTQKSVLLSAKMNLQAWARGRENGDGAAIENPEGMGQHSMGNNG